MKKVRLLALVTAMLMLLNACGLSVSGAEGEENNPAAVTLIQNVEDMFTDRDASGEYDENESIHIQLNGDSIESDSNSVQISGTTAVLTDEGTYILSGTLNDGMIVVSAGEKDKLQLVLNGVTINSETSAPIYILKADKVFLTLAPDTENVLSNGGSFEAVDESNIDAAIFSKQDLTLNGSGSLTVTSPDGHGIVSKDDLVITGGSYVVNAASHGLDANDSVRIVNAAISIAAGKDGIHVENAEDTELGFIYIAGGNLNISAEGDGISAAAYMQIEDGDFSITSGGGSVNASKQSSDSWGHFMGAEQRFGHEDFSPADDDSSTSIKAIKAAGDLLINGGIFNIDSADDAIHSNSSITINGGSYEISSGDDGFHADESLTINDGSIHITQSYEGLEALNVMVAGGDIALVASDDGINAAGGTDFSGFEGQRGDDRFGPGGQFGPGAGSSSNGTIVISGGNLYVQASGDGIDANGTLTITDGYIVVSGPTQGDTSTLDYDVSGEITGGTFIGTGARQMAQTFSASEQGVVAVSVNAQSAGTQLILTDQAGNTIIEHTPELPYEVVILSSPEIEKGETYILNIGSTTTEVTAN